MCSVALLEDRNVDLADPAVAGVPLELLEREICQFAADLAAATCRWLELVAEYDERRGWAEWGVRSCAHWLSWRCGIGLRTAREHVRVGRALAGLPILRGHFRSGEFSYSKVRAITRVAMPETERQLVQIARFASGAQLDKVVRGYAGAIRATRDQARSAHAKQQLDCCWDEDGMLCVRGRLTPENGAVLLDALRSAAPEARAEGDDGDPRVEALMSLVRGEARTDTEVVVHVDAVTLTAETVHDQCQIEDGPVIAPELARRLGCDGALVSIVERDGQPLSVGRRTRVISPALRRALKRRDEGCRFPGCTHTRFLHAHHIEHWARGGPTDLTNLVQLCSFHHRLVHEGGYAVELDEHGTVRFRHPGGWEIPVIVPRWHASEADLAEQNSAGGVRVDADTGRPLTPADRLDYGLAVGGLAEMWLPSAQEPAQSEDEPPWHPIGADP